MARLLSFDEIFADLYEGKEVVIFFPTRKNFDCLRVSLSRRAKNYREMVTKIGGDDPFGDKYLKCTCEQVPDSEQDPINGILPYRGRFRLAPNAEKKNVGVGGMYLVGDI